MRARTFTALTSPCRAAASCARVEVVEHHPRRRRYQGRVRSVTLDWRRLRRRLVALVIIIALATLFILSRCAGPRSPAPSLQRDPVRRAAPERARIQKKVQDRLAAMTIRLGRVPGAGGRSGRLGGDWPRPRAGAAGLQVVTGTVPGAAGPAPTSSRALSVEQVASSSISFTRDVDAPLDRSVLKALIVGAGSLVLPSLRPVTTVGLLPVQHAHRSVHGRGTIHEHRLAAQFRRADPRGGQRRDDLRGRPPAVRQHGRHRPRR